MRNKKTASSTLSVFLLSITALGLLSACGPKASGKPHRTPIFSQKDPDEVRNYKDQPIEEFELQGTWTYALDRPSNSLDTLSNSLTGSLVLDMEKGTYLRTEQFTTTDGKKTQSRSEEGSVSFEPYGDFLRFHADMAGKESWFQFDDPKLVDVYNRQRFCGMNNWKSKTRVPGSKTRCSEVFPRSDIIHVQRVTQDELVLEHCIADYSSRSRKFNCWEITHKRKPAES